MYAQVFKTSEAAKKAWASRKKASKDFWLAGPNKKPNPAQSKALKHADSLAAALGIVS